jgi:hypothetical protein
VDLLKDQNKKLITKGEGKIWMNKLLPTLMKKIESKHFEERKGLFKFDREADIYSDAFSHVLDTLEANPDINTPENQADALRLAVEIADGLDIDKEKDPVKRSELLRSVGKRAIDELNRSLHPSLNHLDELPDAIVEVSGPPQAAIDFLLADPTDGAIKEFDEIFGKGSAKNILK